MFISEALNALEKNDYEITKHCKDYVGHNRLSGRLHTRNTSYVTAKKLGPTILATLLSLPNIKFKINTVNIGRNIMSNANLARLNLQPHQPGDSAEHTQLSSISKIITNYATMYNPDNDRDVCSIYLIRTPSGFSNIKKHFEKANYTPLNIDNLNSYSEHKVIVYKILNVVFIITNSVDDLQLHNFIGWLPILFKEAYTTLKNIPELYDFYKTAYTKKEIKLDNLKEIPCFKNIQQTIRDAKFDKLITSIEKTIVTNLEQQITDASSQIRTLENQLHDFYTKLDTAFRLKSTGSSLENKDLITMCLKNNPNVTGVSDMTNGTFNLIMFGPVDYDRKAMKSSLKMRDAFIQWLFTTTEYTLCWESICSVNTIACSISAIRELSSPRWRIRNTHWHRYQCFGANKAPIIKALTQRDYLGALSQIITAAQLLNPYDITVLDTLITDLTYERASYKSFINNTTKEMYSVNDLKTIFKNLKENKTNEVNNNAQ